ncbi:MAG: hypothetical protein JSS77_09710 [Acidobacteria bacterium]|nr:hypothetical protein [Acidobacteriota bacterium]
MAKDKEEKKVKESDNLFVLHSEEINEAYRRAVREALLKHKKLGNSVVTSRDGKVVILQPWEIEV